MPKYNNSFRHHEYHEESILDKSRNLVGMLRIKPSSLLWKPCNEQKYFAVPLDRFTSWITHTETKAKRTAS